MHVRDTGLAECAGDGGFIRITGLAECAGCSGITWNTGLAECAGYSGCAHNTGLAECASGSKCARECGARGRGACRWRARRTRGCSAAPLLRCSAASLLRCIGSACSSTSLFAGPARSMDAVPAAAATLTLFAANVAIDGACHGEKAASSEPVLVTMKGYARPGPCRRAPCTPGQPLSSKIRSSWSKSLVVVDVVKSWIPVALSRALSGIQGLGLAMLS